jgi:hypothetical protein
MLTNKYSNIYYKIIAKAKYRVTDEYTEHHHIIPESMGGPTTAENMVHLTAREHFICHWLLVKMTEGKDRSDMLYALNGMRAENKHQKRYNTKITARVYEKYIIEFAENHSKRMKGKPAKNKGIPMSNEQKQLLREKAKSNHANGNIYSKESQEKRIAKVLGQKRTDETKRLMSLASKGIPKGPQSDEHKLAISLAGKGIKKKEGHSNNVANAVLGNISINKDIIQKLPQEYMRSIE